MSEMLSMPQFWILAGIVVLITVTLIFLLHNYMQLKHKYLRLNDTVQSNKSDVSGLCAAALTVNNHINSTNQKLKDFDEKFNELLERMNELQQEAVDSPYHVDIRKIREGANVEQLMHDSDLSYDEASLLIRLHGARKNESP